MANPERNKQVAELYLSGMKYYLIPAKLGLSFHQVKYALSRMGVEISEAEKKEASDWARAKSIECQRKPENREKLRQRNTMPDWEVREKVEALCPGFEYIGGYQHSDGKVSLRCRTCGGVIEKSMTTIRHHRKKTICPMCELRRVERRQQDEEQARQKRLHDKEVQRELRKQAEADEYAQRYKKKSCIMCGSSFYTTRTRKICCSPECSRKHMNQLASFKKRGRLEPSKIIDTDISVPKLYERDAGVCGICGGLCDNNDYTYRNGHFIAGDLYPSVDHIIPIAKGGEHSWGNVQLAHRWCNSIKSDT